MFEDTEIDDCVAGCVVFTGGERRHHPSCKHYPESLTKLYDDCKLAKDKLLAALTSRNAELAEAERKASLLEEEIARRDKIYGSGVVVISNEEYMRLTEPCPLVHAHCGACGCAINETDGKCGCEDNRCENIAKQHRDLRTKWLQELARVRQCETAELPSYEEEKDV